MGNGHSTNVNGLQFVEKALGLVFCFANRWGRKIPHFKYEVFQYHLCKLQPD